MYQLSFIINQLYFSLVVLIFEIHKIMYCHHKLQICMSAKLLPRQSVRQNKLNKNRINGWRLESVFETKKEVKRKLSLKKVFPMLSM